MCFVGRLHDNNNNNNNSVFKKLFVSVDCCVQVQRVTIHTGSRRAAAAMSCYGLEARYLFRNVLVYLNK